MSERNTSRTGSSCGSLSGPHGVNGLRVRRWRCAACGCASKTGEELRVEVSYSEGLANRTGLESCAVYREVQGEALTEVRVGPVLSREIDTKVQDADVVHIAEGNMCGRDIASSPCDPARSETWAYAKALRTGTGRSPVRPPPWWSALGRPQRPTPMKHERQKSDPGVVAQKLANKPDRLGAESCDGAKAGNCRKREENHKCRTQRRGSVPQDLNRVRKRARANKKERFTALMLHVNFELLRWAYFRLARDAAAGEDGQTWSEYGEQLDEKHRLA